MRPSVSEPAIAVIAEIAKVIEPSVIEPSVIELSLIELSVIEPTEITERLAVIDLPAVGPSRQQRVG